MIYKQKYRSIYVYCVLVFSDYKHIRAEEKEQKSMCVSVWKLISVTAN